MSRMMAQRRRYETSLDRIGLAIGAGGLMGGAIAVLLMLFGGTFAAKGGIRPASRFDFEIEDPVRKRTIRHGYDVIELPVLG